MAHLGYSDFVRVRHIYISPGHNYFGHHEQPAGTHSMREVPEVECVAGKGLVGDRFFDFKPDYKGQATFLSEETVRALEKEFGLSEIDPSVFRRNILVEGVDLNALIGREFELQGVTFLGTQEAAPCYWMDQALGPGAEAALRGRGGLRVKILTDGGLRAESAVTALAMA